MEDQIAELKDRLLRTTTKEPNYKVERVVVDLRPVDPEIEDLLPWPSRWTRRIKKIIWILIIIVHCVDQVLGFMRRWLRPEAEVCDAP